MNFFTNGLLTTFQITLLKLKLIGLTFFWPTTFLNKKREKFFDLTAFK